jgi:mono/diheme cytochrome c family protein
MNLHSFIFASACAASLSACTPASTDAADANKRGQLVYAKECSQCHGTRGEGGGPASLGMGVVPPDLIGLKQRNDGYFPREFVSRFVMGLLEKDDPNSPMPDFASVGLRHVYPKGGADGEVLEADFEDLLDYLESIQE